ncbi:MAG: thiaminase II [Chloroflexota bacterium]
MSFFAEINEPAAPIWADVFNLPLVRGIAEGTLPEDTFRYYMSQDYKYIVEYARMRVAGAQKAPTPELMASFAEGALFILKGEAIYHRSAARYLGCPVEDFLEGERAPTCEAYLNYMQAAAYNGTFLDVLVATLPCLWGYAHVGRILAERELPDHPMYRLWIETYADPVMQEKSIQMCALLDRLTEDANPATRARLARHYYVCSRYEWMFFDMAWRKEQWPV